MNNLVVLNLGKGDLRSGFINVTALLWEQNNLYPIKFTGGLPAAPEISELYRHWQLIYSALYSGLNYAPRIRVEEKGLNHISEVELSSLSQQLEGRINAWLNSESFRNIDQKLRAHLNLSDEIRLIIETDDNLLRRLPWHLWNFFKHYPKAEVALSATEYQRTEKIITNPSHSKVKILAIIGYSSGIDVAKDRALLEQLIEQAEIKFLSEPRPEDLSEQIGKGWDILFFAGHSSSPRKGLIELNQNDTITLERFKFDLNRAISRGLKLAIFNSCDGLGLAEVLSDLNIPQVIVMREPIPDVVAQEFLKHFLEAFSSGQSLYVSVREAREKLQRLEGKYPCASWLPVICQNPAEPPATWQEWCEVKLLTDKSTRHHHTSLVKCSLYSLLASVTVASLVMGVRYLGILQPWELHSFDQMQGLRPDESPDSRLLLITVFEKDLQLPQQKQKKGSLSDLALAQVLEKILPYKPTVVGLDIYHDFPVDSKYPKLAALLKHDGRFVAVCKSSDATISDPGVAPPPEVPSERSGFSDFITDSDGILRRQLIALTPEPASPCTTPYAFNAELAFRYLAVKGLLPEYTADKALKLGSVVIDRFQTPFGGYQQFEPPGYVLLLNYRSPHSPQYVAPQVSLKDVLEGKVNPKSIKGRIVLIGTTANSFNDYWITPFQDERGSHQQIPGVLAQAQMISQIVSAVLDKRPLLWTLPFWGDAIWVCVWALVGETLAWQFHNLLHLGIALLVAEACLYGFCFVLLVSSGCWVPFVPSVIAVIATSGSVVICLKLQPSWNHRA